MRGDLPKREPQWVAQWQKNKLYEKIRASNNGTGAAALIGNQCKGCHLTLNTIELQRIAGLPEDELVRCEECRCILVRGL